MIGEHSVLPRCSRALVKTAFLLTKLITSNTTPARLEQLSLRDTSKTKPWFLTVTQAWILLIGTIVAVISLAFVYRAILVADAVYDDNSR